jgi:hypothetical protein
MAKKRKSIAARLRAVHRWAKKSDKRASRSALRNAFRQWRKRK